MDEPRKLEDLCDEHDFSVNILGNTYCNLTKRKTECEYQFDNQDQNGLYPCMNPKYNILDYKGTEQ